MPNNFTKTNINDIIDKKSLDTKQVDALTYYIMK